MLAVSRNTVSRKTSKRGFPLKLHYNTSVAFLDMLRVIDTRKVPYRTSSLAYPVERLFSDCSLTILWQFSDHFLTTHYYGQKR